MISELGKAARGILVAVSVLILLLFAVWYTGGNRIAEQFVQRHTQPWAVFQEPKNALPLTGLQARLAGGIVTLCNGSDDEWTHILVQIDQDYLAAVDRLSVGECKHIPVSEFATESWKRMPPPADLKVTRAAVLATVLRRGYAEKALLAN